MASSSSSKECKYIQLLLDIKPPDEPLYDNNNLHSNQFTLSPLNISTDLSNSLANSTWETLHNVINYTNNSNGTDYGIYDPNNTSLEGHPILEDVKFYLLSVVQPTLCCFGILGNILNILVLSRKKFKTSLDCSMEIAAVCGLMSLALSDMFYCLSLLPKAFLNRSITVFGNINGYMVYQMYGYGVQNIFTQISTWFTVLMATTRYIAICRPLQARYLVETRATVVAIITIAICCILLNLPSFWKYSYIELNCPEENLQLFILDQGYFVRHQIFKMVFTCLWSVLGFFIPMCILIYCNIHLIGALRESMRMRKNYSVNNKAASPGSHITPTLIAVICQFILLMTPSEVLNFYYFAIGKEAAEGFTFAIVVANILQTLNFSLNFILYCVVNARFRTTVLQLLKCGRKSQGYGTRSSLRSSAMSNTRHTLLSSCNHNNKNSAL